jgi:ribonuclease P protein component
VALTHHLVTSQWIRRRSDYQQVQMSGRRFSLPHLTMPYLPSSEQVARFGITVSRRVGNAVVRNRVKRRLREVVRHQWQSMEGAWEIVIIARPSAARVGLQILEREFLSFSTWLSRKSQ